MREGAFSPEKQEMTIWFLYNIENIFFQYKPQLKLFHWIMFSVAAHKMWSLIYKARF